jgi:hypothetical protein
MFLTLVLFSFQLFAEPNGPQPIYYNRNPLYKSEGYCLGYILDFHRENLLLWSYEGTMMLGYGTARADMVDPYCIDRARNAAAKISNPAKASQALAAAQQSCHIFQNPWKFSTLSAPLYHKYLSVTETQYQPVMIYFAEPSYSPKTLITHTDTFLYDIYPIKVDLNLPESFQIPEYEMPIGLSINEGKGFSDGRIVKASLDHYFRKSFEVVIQEGVNGNNFRRMSVANQDMFNYIIKAMQTGRMLHIGYVQITGLEEEFVDIAKSYDTNFRIVSVELRERAPLETGLPKP